MHLVLGLSLPVFFSLVPFELGLVARGQQGRVEDILWLLRSDLLLHPRVHAQRRGEAPHGCLRFDDAMAPQLLTKLSADLEAVLAVVDAAGVDEEVAEGVEDAVAVGGPEVEVLVGEDVGDVGDDGLVHLVDDGVAQHLPHHPHARLHQRRHLVRSPRSGGGGEAGEATLLVARLEIGRAHV